MTYYSARAECDFTPMVDRIVEQVQWRVDHAALEKVAGALEEHGYVKVVRCMDCKHYVYEDCSGIFHDDRHNDSYCRRFVSGGLMEVKPDGFCAWGERR